VNSIIRMPDCQRADERVVLRAPVSWRYPVFARLRFLA
jgi:hypothetical protein